MVEAMALEELGQSLVAGSLGFAARKYNVEKGLNDSAKFGFVAAGCAKTVQFRAAQSRERMPLSTEQRRYHQCVISRRHESRLRVQQVRRSTTLVNREIIDYRLHRKR